MRKLSKAVILLLLAFCSVSFGSSKKMTAIVYNEEKTAILVTSDAPQFAIQLKSNPTTGYSWFLKEYDSKLIVPIGHAFENSQDKKLMGAPGIETWQFQVNSQAFVVPQQTVLHFVYARPWETADNAQQLTFKITTSNAK